MSTGTTLQLERVIQGIENPIVHVLVRSSEAEYFTTELLDVSKMNKTLELDYIRHQQFKTQKITQKLRGARIRFALEWEYLTGEQLLDLFTICLHDTNDYILRLYPHSDSSMYFDVVPDGNLPEEYFKNKMIGYGPVKVDFITEELQQAEIYSVLGVDIGELIGLA